MPPGYLLPQGWTHGYIHINTDVRTKVISVNQVHGRRVSGLKIATHFRNVCNKRLLAYYENITKIVACTTHIYVYIYIHVAIA